MNSRPEAVEWPRHVPVRKRRLSDSVLAAFHLACDQQNVEIARDLLGVLEFMARRPPNLRTGKERRAQASLVAAHERLWEIRHLAEQPSVNLGRAFARGFPGAGP
jgi:hypothetical protein